MLIDFAQLSGSQSDASPTGPDADFGRVTLLIQPGRRDASVVDKSRRTTSLTLMGQAALSRAIPDPAGGRRPVVALDEAGDYVLTGSANGFNPATGRWTIEGWVHATSGGRNSLFSARIANGDTRFYCDWLTDNFYIGDGYRNPIAITDRQITGSWYHWAAVSDGRNLAAYKAGRRLRTTTARLLNNTMSDFQLGGRLDQRTYLSGYLSGVRVTDGVARYSGASIAVPTFPLPEK